MRSIEVPTRRAAQILNRINGAATTRGEHIKSSDIAEVIENLVEAGVSTVRIEDFVEYATESSLTVFRGPSTEQAEQAWNAAAFGPHPAAVLRGVR